MPLRQVYFTEDSNVLKNVAEEHIRVPLMQPRFNRDNMVGRTFDDDGDELFVPGSWEVCEVNQTNGIEYKCVRLSGGDEVGETREFDVGYVIRLIQETEKKVNGFV